MTDKTPAVATATEAPYITALVTLPPPTTGQTTVSRCVIDLLKKQGNVRIFDWSNGSIRRGLAWKVEKACRNLLCVIYLIVWRCRLNEHLYTVANDGNGLWWNCLHICIARMKGYSVVIHHHSFKYLHRWDLRMALLHRLAGRRAVHVVLAIEMRESFRSMYGDLATIVEVPNTILFRDVMIGLASAKDASRLITETNVSDQVISQCTNASVNPPAFGPIEVNSPLDGTRPLRLGHLSNLSIEKGIGRVIDVFRDLRRNNRNVELHVAGPCKDAEVARIVADCKSSDPQRVFIYGPVFGEDKSEFFRHIDAFLFPSLYPTEAQPLVVLEAMLEQSPVITFAIGCIPSLIGESGLAVSRHETTYRQEAVKTIEGWLDKPETFALAIDKVNRNNSSLLSSSEHSVREFLSLCGMVTS